MKGNTMLQHDRIITIQPNLKQRLAEMARNKDTTAMRDDIRGVITVNATTIEREGIPNT